MALSHDELALRAALDDLANGQPPSPAGRYDAVRRRAARRRARQAGLVGGALAVAAAAVIGGFSLAARQASPAPASSRHLPVWALPWPDHRDGSVPQRVLDGAVTAWRFSALQQSGVLPHPVRVIWYAGQVMPAGHDVVAVFEIDSAAGRQLAVGIASASQVMQGQPGWSHGASPWVVASIPAPNPRREDLAIGFNDAVLTATGRSPDNFIVVLTGPQIRRIGWTADTTTGRYSTTARTSAGLVIADSGQVIGRVLLTSLLTRSGNVLRHPVPIGLPTSAGQAASQAGPPWFPALAAPPGLREPRSFRLIIGESGTGGVPQEAVSRTRMPHQPGQRAAVFARCYGPAPLTISVGQNASGGHVIGHIRCDDVQHELLVPAGQRLREGSSLIVQTGPLTSYVADLGFLG